MSRITNVEKAMLEKYDFNTLEYTTMKQMYDELALLQKWSASDDVSLCETAEKYSANSCVKELKFIEAKQLRYNFK